MLFRSQLRGNRIAMIFQDPMMTLNPVLRIETQMMETVLAHEIGHVLERMDRHSTSGIMQEHFSSQEIDRMSRGPLSFAAEDVELIHEGLESVHAK